MIPALEPLAARLGQLAAATPAVSRPPVPAAAAPGAEAEAATVAPVNPIQLVDHARRGWHLDAAISPRQVVLAAEILSEAGFALDAVTGVDWIAQNEMEVVYDYFHPAAPLRVAVRARIPRQDPELPTIATVFPGANWHERETHDFFGIRFAGHPNLTPFLLPEDATYHPLRKDFSA